jgi:hypothetical protein
MFKRLLLAVAMGAAIIACTPGTNSGATVAPSVGAPSNAAPSDSAMPSESTMPSDSASPSAS